MSLFAPRRVRVAVTGHRLNQLPEAAHPAVKAAIEKALATVEESAKAAADGHATMVLVSALAEGADRIAAHAALARGWPMTSPLPFRKARYEEDFAEAHSVAEFRALFARARRREEIDGEALQRAGEGDAAPYAAVGRRLAALGEVLVAVWNGQPPKGPGGTAEVCARMLAKGGPVLWIDAEGVGPRLIKPTQKVARGFKARLMAELSARLTETPRPEAMRVAAG
jgi:hypothetical protein